MVEYTIEFKCREYKKAKPDLRKSIEKGMRKLVDLIESKEQSGTAFEKIFNDDVLKYDILGKNFYTFKFRCGDSTQLRLLYKFNRAENKVELHKFYEKRHSGKEYMAEFQRYVNMAG